MGKYSECVFCDYDLPKERKKVRRKVITRVGKTD